MKKIIINYCSGLGVDSFDSHKNISKGKPYDYIPIGKYIDFEDKSFFFTECPAWNEWASTTFISYCQEDVYFTFHSSTNSLTSPNSLENALSRIYPDAGWLNGPLPTIQYANLEFFWTDEPDVWIEQFSLPGGIKNCELVPATFPISVWHRPLLAAFKIQKDSPIIIKKGQPLYCIRFRTNERANIVLKESVPTEKQFDQYKHDSSYKRIHPKQAWPLIQKRLKCPVEFLWK